MKQKFKKVIKSLIPPLIQTGVKNLFSKSSGSFSGPYKTWAQAQAHSSGYQDVAILEKIKQSTLTVQSNSSYAIRDGILFCEPQYSFPVLAALLKITLTNNNSLSVLDFGGALGSSYYSFKQFYTDKLDLKWSIIEQQAYVECGNQLFKNNELHFYSDISKVPQHVDVIFLSATLQYLDKPYEWLNIFLNHNAPYLLLDRVLFSDESNQDHILVEHVAKEIYASSYPFWLFHYQSFKQLLLQKYDILCEFDALEGKYQQNGFDITSKGFFLRRKQ